MIGASAAMSINNNSYDNIGVYSPAQQKPENTNSIKTDKAEKTSLPQDCKTCSERKYQDKSNENVSFKSPGHISPASSASVVRAHEQEHVSNAYSKAAKDNGEVISATVTLKTDVCTECGRVYVAGGTTNTRIKYQNENDPYQKNKKSFDSMALSGMNIDIIK